MKKRLFSATLGLMLVVAFVLSVAAAGTIVSEGKIYSLVTPASEAYPDDGTKLTDGVFGTIPEGSTSYYSSGAYVGFSKDNLNDDGNFVIILDLGESYADLNAFTVGYLNETTVGVYAPKTVSFAISGDRNGEYTELGTLNTEKTDPEATASTYADTFETENASGQFVRITITPAEYTDSENTTQTANWTFIDEISVQSATTNDESSVDDSTSEDISESLPESSDPESSEPESGLEPESEEVSEDLSVPQTGDDGFGNIAFVLLAFAAIAMTAALFINARRKEEF